MTSSNHPARIPERAPGSSESQTNPGPAWPRPEKRVPRVPIKLIGGIPG